MILQIFDVFHYDDYRHRRQMKKKTTQMANVSFWGAIIMSIWKYG